MKKRHSRKLLQVSLGICALVAIFSGLLGMAGNNNPVYSELEKPVGLPPDSYLCFLNGLSAGIGVCTLFLEAALPPIFVLWQSRTTAGNA